MTDDRTQRQKFASVYGRGYHDGMNSKHAAEPQKEDPLNAAREDAQLRGQTDLARRVHECVPIQESWQAVKIRSEVVRKFGSAPSLSTISGCLNTLRDAGLVQETSPLSFARKPVRVHVKQAAEPIVKLVSPVEVQEAQEPPAAPAAFSPLERIALLSERVAEAVKHLQALSSEIESVALETQDYIDRVNKDGGKLRQLQALLKDLS